MSNSELNAQSNRPAITNPGNTSGFNVQNSELRPVVVKPVDARSLAGTNAPSDTIEKESADFSTEQFKNQAGPRGETSPKGA